MSDINWPLPSDGTAPGGDDVPQGEPNDWRKWAPTTQREANELARQQADRLFERYPELAQARARLNRKVARNRAEDQVLWGAPDGRSLVEQILSW